MISELSKSFAIIIWRCDIIMRDKMTNSPEIQRKKTNLVNKNSNTDPPFFFLDAGKSFAL